MAKTKTKGTAKTVSDTPVPQPITIRSTNPKIMADNILKLEESIKAADVSANPSGEAEETLLTSIGIDGKKYNIGASAENTSYDNTDSGLIATDTQGAIDEIAGEVVVQTDEFAYTDPLNYEISFNYGDYKLIGINTLNSSNQVLNSAIVPMEYFKTVNRVIMGNFMVAYGGNNLLYASAAGGSADVTKVVIFTILK